ncbi:hypothetical protein MRB53_017612 [Persea americana]|uniref:Uncharacterized protein n=1 Tax=Persea americana TaxID=3435 RepID=A0ACC2M632_PERAE|nr:hypothetical protein MRB53_017612 [Persea americana]
MSHWMSTEPAMKEMDDESDFTFCQAIVRAVHFSLLVYKEMKMIWDPQKPFLTLAVSQSVTIHLLVHQDQKAVTKKPVAREKFLFEKGFNQMDWLKITRKHSDLADFVQIRMPLYGTSYNGDGIFSLNKRSLNALICQEFKQFTRFPLSPCHFKWPKMFSYNCKISEPIKRRFNNRGESICWTVLKGRVYNISPYMKFHPGGVDMLMKAAGKDCTSLFNKYHAWVNAEFLLEKCLVGILDGDR